MLYTYINRHAGTPDKNKTKPLYVVLDVRSSHIAEYMDQPGKVAKPARGQLNRENKYSLVPIRPLEFGLAGQVQPSRPASACSFSKLRQNLVLTYGIPPEFRGGVHLFI